MMGTQMWEQSAVSGWASPKPWGGSDAWIGVARLIGHPLCVQGPVGWKEAQTEGQDVGCG